MPSALPLSCYSPPTYCFATANARQRVASANRPPHMTRYTSVLNYIQTNKSCRICRAIPSIFIMTWQSEFWSWMSPRAVPTAATPAVGQKAPSSPALHGKPTIVSFLRHCGCPCKSSLVTTGRQHNLNDMDMSSRREDFFEFARPGRYAPKCPFRGGFSQPPRVYRPLARCAA